MRDEGAGCVLSVGSTVTAEGGGWDEGEAGREQPLSKDPWQWSHEQLWAELGSAAIFQAVPQSD